MKKQAPKKIKNAKPRRTSISTLVGDIKQLSFPKELRIRRGPLPENIANKIEDFSNLTKTTQKPTTEPIKEPLQITEERTALREHLRLIVDVGTGLWRLRQKMIKPGTEEPLEEMRKAFRHFESVWDTLSNAGVKIQDHTHNSFDSGLSLKVISFQPTPGINRETIIETIKPSIYYKDRTIQMGEVIVGTPEGHEGKEGIL